MVKISTLSIGCFFEKNEYFVNITLFHKKIESRIRIYMLREQFDNV